MLGIGVGSLFVLKASKKSLLRLTFSFPPRCTYGVLQVVWENLDSSSLMAISMQLATRTS